MSIEPYMLTGKEIDIPLVWRCKHDHGVTAIPGPWLCSECTADDAFVLYDKVNMAYRTGTPVMSDERFNVFEDFLRKRHPGDMRFHKVGETSERDV